MDDLVMKAPKLECYSLHDNPPPLVPGVGERDWMDFSNQRFAYRCTPLTMANQSGWELLNPSGFSATWTGLNSKNDIILRPDDPSQPLRHATLGFGHGILTFHPGYLFRTAPGWMVWARGAPNRLKHGIQALDGLVETNWLPFTFTMNWKFTEPGTIYFAKGEPFCFITMVPSLAIETVQPVVQPISEVPELEREYKIWNSERIRFNAGLELGDPVTVEQKWQKNYLMGKSPSGKSVADENHRVKRSLKAPVSATPPQEDGPVDFLTEAVLAADANKSMPVIVMRQAFPSFQVPIFPQQAEPRKTEPAPEAQTPASGAVKPEPSPVETAKKQPSAAKGKPKKK